MENIKSWAVCAVASAVIAAVINAVSPGLAGEKSLKFITAVFVVVLFASPFISFDFDKASYTDYVDEYIENHKREEAVEEGVINTLSSQISSSISAYVSTIGAGAVKTNIKMDIDSDKNITIKSISITAPALTAEQTQKIKAYVYDNFAIEPEIKNSNGEG